LGVRGDLAKYSYSEIFESMMAIYLTGGSRIEDAKRLSAQFSEKSQGYRLFSPDTRTGLPLRRAACGMRGLTSQPA